MPLALKTGVWGFRALPLHHPSPTLDTVWKDSSSTPVLYGAPMSCITFLALTKGRSSWVCRGGVRSCACACVCVEGGVPCG